MRLIELRELAESRDVSIRLIELEPYEPCRVVGVVERLRIDPGNGYIEAVIVDGTAEVVARWFIRSPARELAVVPGRVVVLEGIAVRGDYGRLVFEEPASETIEWPEVA